VLEVAIAAPPAHGKANAELIRTLATAFGRRKGEIPIVLGASSRGKLVRVAELIQSVLLATLGPWRGRLRRGLVRMVRWNQIQGLPDLP
jgi:uncharacterized protein YggU (UPF0235/DUF167 family)